MNNPNNCLYQIVYKQRKDSPWTAFGIQSTDISIIRAEQLRIVRNNRCHKDPIYAVSIHLGDGAAICAETVII